MGKTFKVASVQFNPMLHEREKNLKQLFPVIEEAARNGAKLIVTPEMATTGYHYASRECITPFVDTIPGMTTDYFQHISNEYGVYIVIGMPEVDEETGLYYNSAALIGPRGVIGRYRKTHLWETEEHWAVWGDEGIPVFDTELGRIAITICMDSIFFESARIASIQGANILAFPTNSTAQSISFLQARAETNGLYVISANRSNTELDFHMIGASAVWSPDGEKLAEAKYIPSPDDDIHEPTILYAEIETDRFTNTGKTRMKERRPDLYKDLMLYISPWDFTREAVSRKLHVSALQYEPIIADKRATLDKIEGLLQNTIEEAISQEKKIDLVVLPEMSLTGPVHELDQEQIVELAENMNGLTFSEMKKLTNRYKVAIVYGFIERKGNNLHNTAVLISSDGQVDGIYRQTHVDPKNKKWATAGDNIDAFMSKELGKVGIMIGYDALFPEVAGLMAVKRADIIVLPTSWTGEYGRTIGIEKRISKNRYSDGAVAIWEAIALGSQAYTVVANFTGTNHQFRGRSGIYTVDPLYGLDQPVIASEDKEESLISPITTIPTEWWFNQQKLISSRRTAFYKRLIYKTIT